MNTCIDMLRHTRRHLLSILEDLSMDQLNDTPSGFNNNIVWNVSHMIASQQGVCYKRAGVPLIIPESFFMEYKPDTRPERYIDANEFQQTKETFLSSLDVLERDYNNNLFKNYIPWTTRYGVPLANIDETLQFLVFHEGLHFGYVMALRHLV
ncbi:DinB family protein [Segetibacter sp. 3557_3]|uniref:DinB family protein n=1 Tax=Segetibacter sp. 3557_3 TaxID=2547429 RepID=UPI001058FA91|nr:DinB family protein [Segetibacter sp. 3557_3]TDH28854.1 DinB family protein [Segetibacter sp. 3557_3]